MQKFHNILFVSHGATDDTDALKQALSIARNNKAEFKALITCPELPKKMNEYREKYLASLKENLEKSIATARDTLNISESDLATTIEVECGKTPSIRIIRHAIKGGHDLVIKQAEPQEDKKGFKALDMDLLRKCPCAVWLCRPITASRDDIRVAVAVDPESEEQAGHDLTLRLLQLSRSLADTCDGTLDVVSCWSYELENELRYNVWIKMPEKELAELVEQARADHRALLDATLAKSTIGGQNEIHHLKGAPEKNIPEFVDRNGVDILVMGTVARTGIPGFIFGNTAENVVQEIGCSLLALKPNGFVSPIKAY